MTSNNYFDDLFEKLVAIHERLDTASITQKEQLVVDLEEIENQGEDIYKQWIILKEYIEILNNEYNLKHHDDQNSPVLSAQNNEMNETSNQVFWVADEESITTFRKGLGYFELLMYENSVEYFKETVAKDPEFMMARVYLGLCYLSLGKLNEAESELKKALLFTEEGSPYIALANHALGCIYAQLKKFELSQKYFQDVIDINAGFDNIYFNLGATYYNQQKYECAKLIFVKGLEIKPNDWELHFLVGKCDMFLMRFEQSIKYLKNAFQLSKRIEIGLTLGKVYEITNQIDSASSIYNQLLEIFPNESELYHRIGWLNLYTNDYQKAVLSIKRAIILQPKNEAYIFTLGWIYLHANNYKKAKICFNYIDKLNNKNVLSTIGLAKLSDTSKNYDTAKDYLLDAIRRITTKHDLGILTYHLGYYWLQRKSYNKSLYSFKASLNYAPYLTESNFYIHVLQKITSKKNIQPIG